MTYLTRRDITPNKDPARVLSSLSIIRDVRLMSQPPAGESYARGEVRLESNMTILHNFWN
jgi:hypothetical protein